MVFDVFIFFFRQGFSCGHFVFGLIDMHFVTAVFEADPGIPTRSVSDLFSYPDVFFPVVDVAFFRVVEIVYLEDIKVCTPDSSIFSLIFMEGFGVKPRLTHSHSVGDNPFSSKYALDFFNNLLFLALRSWSWCRFCDSWLRYCWLRSHNNTNAPICRSRTNQGRVFNREDKRSIVFE